MPERRRSTARGTALPGRAWRLAAVLLTTVPAHSGLAGGCAVASPASTFTAALTAAVAPRFVAAGDGPRFRHVHGGTGRYYIVESMGAGAGFLDYDRDGRPDAYLVQGAPIAATPGSWSGSSPGAPGSGSGSSPGASESASGSPPGSGSGPASGSSPGSGSGPASGSSPGSSAALRADRSGGVARRASPAGASRGEPTDPVNVLFRNLGGGRFAPVPVAGAADRGYGMGVSVADYDADGFPDLYVTNWGPNALYRNLGDGTFAPVDAGVADEGWGTSSTWADLDADGWLDLFVVNYLDWQLDDHRPCHYGPDRIESYCGPELYAGAADVLYRNRGDGRFDDVSSEAGVVNAADGKGLGVAAADYDDDGDVDLYVANDTRPNFLWTNDSAGRFVDDALLAGVAFSGEGRAQAGMGVDWGDVDGDLDLDLVVTNFQDDYNTLYTNRGDGTFDDATADLGLRTATLGWLAFGVDLADLDNDADLDVLIANGHIFDAMSHYNPAVLYAQPNQLFVNDGGRLRGLEPEALGALASPAVSRGMATADVDDDGDLDVLIANNADEALLAINTPGSGSGNFLLLTLVGRGANRDGYGARVVVETTAGRQVAEHLGASSYLSHNDPRLHFGLGDADQATLTVRWPSGTVDRIETVEANRRLVIVEGRGAVAGR